MVLGGEHVEAGQPDLILLWPDSVGPAMQAQLRGLGIALIEAQPHSFDELAGQLAQIGAALGHRDAGEQLAERMRAGARSLAADVRPAARGRRHRARERPCARGRLRAQNTWFAGAWMRNGFHEDGFASAYDVVQAMRARTAEGQLAA